MSSSLSLKRTAVPLDIACRNYSSAGEERTPLWWSPHYLDHLAVVFSEDVRCSGSGLLPSIVLCACMRVCSQWVKVLVSQSCLTLWDPMDCSSPGPSILGLLQARSNGVGCHSLLQGVFPTLELNLGFLHFRQILYHLSHQRRLMANSLI